MVGTHRVIILNRGSMFAFQWREFSPPLSSAHRLLPLTKERYETLQFPGNAEHILPPQPPPPPQLGPFANERAVSSDVTLWRCTFWSWKICISFFLFYCEVMLALVVLWLCVGSDFFFKSLARVPFIFLENRAVVGERNLWLRSFSITISFVFPNAFHFISKGGNYPPFGRQAIDLLLRTT